MENRNERVKEREKGFEENLVYFRIKETRK
jgi:hypothetical protein